MQQGRAWKRRDLGACSKPEESLSYLLIGPYDPFCGEYTFLAPPLGVWRLCGYLRELGHEAEVFDPNCCEGEPEAELETMLRSRPWSVVGVSTTGMTLRYDLSLAHLVRRIRPEALLVAGGMEATFEPELVAGLAPFDLIALGEGEHPLRAIGEQLLRGAPLVGIPGTAVPLNDGGVHRFHGHAMGYEELRAAIAATPYESMPFATYWERLEQAYSVHGLTEKGDREARLAEIRSIRVPTLNYCPMACTFCSSTNFLHEAQGKVASIARLDAGDCLDIVARAVATEPGVRTIIFQDDIFVFTKDKRIEPLCNEIIARKRAGSLPADLQFISTNRIDAMTPERLQLMKSAGFRVLGFGIENFSSKVLREFNKGQIARHVTPRLNDALSLGMTPFLDLILSSPRATLADVAITVNSASHWLSRGCEVGLYPWVIPFSGSAMSRDPELADSIEYEEQKIPGTDVSWQQGTRIRPLDDLTNDTMLDVERRYRRLASRLEERCTHMPSRVRSLLWIAAAIPELRRHGYDIPPQAWVDDQIDRVLADSAHRRSGTIAA